MKKLLYLIAGYALVWSTTANSLLPTGIDLKGFERLHRLILPQTGESPWREIDWIVNITEARKRAIMEDKPILIFTAADGSPLGRT